MLDDSLWTKIVAYDLDKPLSEYGFSTRVAKENYWTKNFTRRAVVEYKKFMYLAAKSNMMVSPSPIVDIIWHEHLTFTKSYQEFCDILGKHIDHVPSTHARDDFEKFKAAKERTLRSYVDTFGMPPEDLWIFPGMFESLRLEKAKYKLRSFTLAGILVLAALIVPAYFLLRPMYVQIGNPSFGWGYFFLGLFVVLWFPLYNRTRRRSIVEKAHAQSFVFDLHPMEVVYLKTSSIERVIDGTLNRLIVDKKITAGVDRIFLVEGAIATTPEEFSVIDLLDRVKDGKSMHYESLLEILKGSPPFANIRGSMEALNKYVIKSKAFASLFSLNFIIMGVVLLLGVTRIATGLMRDKPVDNIVMLVCFFGFLFALILVMLTVRAVSQPLGAHYSDKASKLTAGGEEWEWSYALRGNQVLLPAMVVLAGSRDSSGNSSSDSSSSSGDSSCGSSCGGCGGGD
jgi:hypothetical protein